MQRSARTNVFTARKSTLGMKVVLIVLLAFFTLACWMLYTGHRPGSEHNVRASHARRNPHAHVRNGFYMLPYGAPVPALSDGLRARQVGAWAAINGATGSGVKTMQPPHAPPPRMFGPPPGRCCAAVIQESRTSPQFMASLASMHAHLPDYWSIHVLLPSASVAWFRQQPEAKAVAAAREVFMTVEERHFDHTNVSSFMEGPWLWDRMVAAKVLMFQSDSVMCTRPEDVAASLPLEAFLPFDFVGAPFAHIKSKATGEALVGNGCVGGGRVVPAPARVGCARVQHAHVQT